MHSIQMRIFLTGVSCVGTTTIGKKMGKLLGVRFFDLDPDWTKIKRLVKSKRLSRNLTGR
jgi:shikimate kinase